MCIRDRFGSGSFFDERQIPKDSRIFFIEKAREKDIKKIVLESRPEFVKKEVLDEFKGLGLTVAFGLETAVPELLKAVKKGFTVQDYDRAASMVKESGFGVRTYLLVNIPGDADVKGNLKKSVDHALNLSDSIVIINLLPHGNTPLFKLWINGEWTFLSKEEFNGITAPYKDNPKIELDFETFRFTPKFPKQYVERLDGVGEQFLTHPHFEVWHDYILRFYEIREGRSLLFLPCSFSKPYSKSKTHRAIIQALEDLKVRSSVHEVMLSNAGVIPRELEDNYPFNSYNWDESLETPAIKERYIQVTAERIENYLKAHGKKYSGVYCFLKHSSESYLALEIACKKLSINFKNLLNSETESNNQPFKISSVEAIEDLRENSKWFARNSM